MLQCEIQIRTVSDKLGNILEYHQVSILIAEKWNKAKIVFKLVHCAVNNVHPHKWTQFQALGLVPLPELEQRALNIRRHSGGQQMKVGWKSNFENVIRIQLTSP